MPALPQISDAEWHVMKVLWDHPGDWLAPAEIIDPMVRQRRISHRTVRTMLARLVKKGAVETRPEGASYQYHAKLSQEAAVRQESRSFLTRVFNGAAAPALVHFLRQAKLSPQEIAHLKKILDEEKPR